jgi:prepilin-type N-terminal cleavage/methylation domain-containing protein
LLQTKKLKVKDGFTIIEVIVSVVIISIVVLGLTKINRQNIDMANYVASRNKSELSNTLFLTREAAKYNRSEKDAYTLLHNMHISKLETRQYLKKIKRKIYIDRDIRLKKMVVPLNVTAIILKSKYATRYYRFNP